MSFHNIFYRLHGLVIFLSGCDICPAHLFFRAGINVFLSPKAEAAAQTHHFGRKIFSACSATTSKKPPQALK